MEGSGKGWSASGWMIGPSEYRRMESLGGALCPFCRGDDRVCTLLASRPLMLVSVCRSLGHCREDGSDVAFRAGRGSRNSRMKEPSNRESGPAMTGSPSVEPSSVFGVILAANRELQMEL